MTGSSGSSGAPASAGADGSSPARWRGLAPWLIALAGLIALSLVIGAPGSTSSSDLDPHSTQTGGTKAMVMLLSASGARVAITDQVPTSGTDVAVLLADTTSQHFTDQLQRWVSAGGVLVVADPDSSFVPVHASSNSSFGALDERIAAAPATSARSPASRWCCRRTAAGATGCPPDRVAASPPVTTRS